MEKKLLCSTKHFLKIIPLKQEQIKEKEYKGHTWCLQIHITLQCWRKLQVQLQHHTELLAPLPFWLIPFSSSRKSLACSMNYRSFELQSSLFPSLLLSIFYTLSLRVPAIKKKKKTLKNKDFIDYSSKRKKKKDYKD